MNIKQLAQITGYSYATVARALSSKGYCSKEKKEKILQIASEYGYEPNNSAKCLRVDKTERVLICISNLRNAFYHELVSGMADVLNEKSYSPMIFTSDFDINKELKAISMLRQKSCDGMILTSIDFNERNIEAIRESKRPVVLTNRYLKIRENDNFDYVYMDHVKAMRIATEHLIQQGCKKIALCIGDLSNQTFSERIEGYYDGLRENEIDIIPELVISSTDEGGSFIEKFEEFLDKEIEFDGLIAASGVIGLDVYKTCHKKNIKIGTRFKMVAFDNVEYTTIIEPNITVIDMRERAIGKEAAKLLLERLVDNREESKTVVLEPKLIIRQSSM